MDDPKTKIQADVQRHGWHVVMVAEGGPGEPPFAYTIGLQTTCAHPEFIIIGLPHDVSHPVLNELGRRIQSGDRFVAGDTIDELLEGCKCRMDTVEALWLSEYVGQALQFYDSPSVGYLQCLWPDRVGRYPSDQEFALALRFQQPWLASTWHFQEPQNVAVFTVRQVIDGAIPVLRVIHDDDDGAWQFLPGREVPTADAILVALSEIVKLDPTVCYLASLPCGWTATRGSPQDPWERDCATSQ